MEKFRISGYRFDKVARFDKREEKWKTKASKLFLAELHRISYQQLQ